MKSLFYANILINTCILNRVNVIIAKLTLKILFYALVFWRKHIKTIVYQQFHVNLIFIRLNLL